VRKSGTSGCTGIVSLETAEFAKIPDDIVLNRQAAGDFGRAAAGREFARSRGLLSTGIIAGWRAER
jgi:hypothetical protein